MEKKHINLDMIKDNIQAYEVLSYISIFWIIGLFVSEKDNKELKFHVGQGMILTIFEIVLTIAVNIINNLFIANIFKTEITYLGMGTKIYTTSSFGMTLMSILNFIVIAVSIIYSILGIKNVLKSKKKELPFIGMYAFYK